MRKFVHPVLFALYAVLFLYSHNVRQIGFRHAVWPLLIVGAAALLLYVVCLRLMPDRGRAALAASLFWILFFSFGRVHSAITGTRVFTPEAGFYYPLLALWIAIFCVSVWRLVLTQRDLEPAGRFLNIVAISLMVIVAANLVFSTVQGEVLARRHAEMYGEEPPVQLDVGDSPRDIYYIIPDGYPSSSTLKEVYGYDNSYFIEALRDLGFFVAEDSRSNYPMTTLSLSSSLNMRHLDDLTEVPGRDSRDLTVPHGLIEDNLVARSLQEHGYRFVHFNSGWGPTIQNLRADDNYLFGRLGDEFAEALVNQTPLMPALGGDGARTRVLETFSALSRVPEEVDGPRFVFSHILPPHPPYLFDRHGDPLERAELEMTGDVWKNREGYLEQLRYVNRRMEQMLKDILAQYDSGSEPIIIIQSDHGTASLGERPDGGWSDPDDDFMRERSSILHALLVPDDVRDHLYPSITPVNTFRLIFAGYFGAEMERKEDVIFFSNYNRPFDLREVTGRVR